MFGLIPDSSVIEAFEEAGGKGKPKLGQVHVCLADSEEKARKTALEWWPNAVAGGNLPWELPLPSHFESATEWADEDAIAEEIVCATEPEPFVEAISEYVDAGYDHVYFHQVGPEQERFLEFSERSFAGARESFERRIASVSETLSEGIWTGEDNSEATAAWDGPLFEVWRDYRELIEGGLVPHGERALELYPPPAGGRCLDIGCGFGDTTFRMAELVGEAAMPTASTSRRG